MSIAYQNNSLLLRKLFNYLLSSISEDGSWKDFDESWGPITTALTCDLLLDAGIDPACKWYIQREQYKPITLQKSFIYLNNCIREDGSFGTDLWDALKLGKVIVAHEIKNHFPNFDKLHSYILSRVRSEDIFDTNSQWSGPAFLACAIEYLDLVRLNDLAEEQTEKLIKYQRSDGCWAGPLNKEGNPAISPVWHTSQVIWILNRKDSKKYKTEITKAVNWLKKVQESDGSWIAVNQFEVYFTSYALIALSEFRGRKEINKGIEYLSAKIQENGKCADLGGTLMCSIAFWELNKKISSHSMSFMEYLLASNASEITTLLDGRLSNLNSELKAKEEIINDYKEKYSNADIVITKRQGFFIGLSLALIGLFSSLGGFPGISQIIKSLKTEGTIENKQTIPKENKKLIKSDTITIKNDSIK